MEELDRQDEQENPSVAQDFRDEGDAVPAKTGVTLTASGNTWVNKGGWGQREIIFAGILGFLFLLCAGYLAFFVNPEKSAADSRRREVQSRESELLEARDRYGKITSTEEQVARLVGSADRFESEHLPNESTGKTALYQRINNLISSNGLINTAGPSYRQLDSNATGQEPGSTGQQEGSASRLRSIFPGVVVSVTVEGSYQRVRNFLRQLETSEQFIVISSVALEPSDRSRSASEQEITGEVPASKVRGDVVSLKIEFAAYFRRAEGEW